MSNSDTDNSVALTSRIHEYYHFLSKTQRRIAKYVLENKEVVLTSSITVLAKKLNTTPASITRFCQALRYEGYNELKFHLKTSIQSEIPAQSLLSKEEYLSDSILHFMNMDITAIKDTLQLLDQTKLKQAIHALIKAKKIYFYAEGATGASAMFAYQLFLQIGLPCNCFTDASLMMLSAAHLEPGDVVICMSYSGSSENVFSAMRQAQRNKAVAIGITAFSKTRIGRLSDICLSYSCNIPDDLQYLHIARMCELSIIGILQSNIVFNMLQTENPGSLRLQELKNTISSKRFH